MTFLMMIIIGIHDSEGAILMRLNSPEFPSLKFLLGVMLKQLNYLEFIKLQISSQGYSSQYVSIMVLLGWYFILYDQT